jgi:hypothetical protein
MPTKPAETIVQCRSCKTAMVLGADGKLPKHWPGNPIRLCLSSGTANHEPANDRPNRRK